MSSKTGLQINSNRDCIKKPFMAVLFKNYLSAVQGTNSGVTHKCEFEIRPWSAARLLFKIDCFTFTELPTCWYFN